ncbi:hypothetical protein FNV43_RR24728 [Rhamnella rubrinervis]|uniref:LIM zinc-binding domain-containing protein n=1 Tax=Rhamnella rubrinervis TaxID=2594499 RepID=A0A8K0DMA9_9ROSA|nr:hypothetical protein FNV43_RR24728 [Rhamnella rubrinervis]
MAGGIRNKVKRTNFVKHDTVETVPETININLDGPAIGADMDKQYQHPSSLPEKSTASCKAQDPSSLPEMSTASCKPQDPSSLPEMSTASCKPQDPFSLPETSTNGSIPCFPRLGVIPKDHHSRQKEKDELDSAIAVSMAEDSKRPSVSNSPGYRWQRENDEDFSRALHDDLHPPFYTPHAPQQYYSMGNKICGGCKREIIYGKYLLCMGTYFHPQCFCCRFCGRPVTESEFSISGKDPFHKICFKELAHPKCEVCHQFSWYARYITMEDGRSLCLECMESAIMDTGDCQPLYHAVRDFFEGMNVGLEQQIPMLLVERQALNEAFNGVKYGFKHMLETMGLCLSEEQTVTSILTRPRVRYSQLIGMRTQPQKLTRKCEVTAVLVLYGLPRLLTGAILAHVLMRSWLRLNEGGICQMLSHMWFESEVMPGSRSTPSTSSAASSSSSWPSSKKGGKSNVENQLGEFFLRQIANDVSTAYGGGFRAANAAVSKYGLRHTLEHIPLEHIRWTGNFP